MTDGATQRRRDLVHALESSGAIRSEAVKRAFLAVPREMFVPEVAARDGLDTVYRAEAALVTRTDRRGAGISSSSAPSIMAPMLEALDLAPGLRVLEVGAGTGYNAALLSLLVGPTGHVTTIDIEPDITRAARTALQRGDYRARVATGDGRAGFPVGAPFDRIIVTASSPGIPLAWRDQLVEDGLLELPLQLDGDLSNQLVVTFRRRNDVLESTTILAGGFMGLRDEAGGDAPPWGDSTLAAGATTARGTRHFARLTGRALGRMSARSQRELLVTMLEQPRTVVRRMTPADADGLALLVSLRAGRDRVRCGEVPRFGVGIFSSRDSSVACVMRTIGRPASIEAWGGGDAEQRLLALHDEWRQLGRPRIDEFRLTAAASRAGVGTPLRTLPCGDFVVGIAVPPEVRRRRR